MIVMCAWSVIDPRRTIRLTTWDYLRQLEESGRIQSVDAALDAAREAGRHAEAFDLWEQHDPEIPMPCGSSTRPTGQNIRIVDAAKIGGGADTSGSLPDAGQIQLILPGALKRFVVSGIGVAHHARGGVVPQHARDAPRRFGGAVADHHHAGVLRIADADAAAVMDRDPGGARRAVRAARSASASRRPRPSRPASPRSRGWATRRSRHRDGRGR